MAAPRNTGQVDSPTEARAWKEAPHPRVGVEPGAYSLLFIPTTPSPSNWLGFPETEVRQREVGLGGEFFPDVFVVWQLRARAPGTPTLPKESEGGGNIPTDSGWGVQPAAALSSRGIAGVFR